jgi:alkaline phosphatase D
VDTRDLEKPILKLEVVIDGLAAYQYVFTSMIAIVINNILLSLTIAGKPVKLYPSTALGALVPRNFNKMFHKMGLTPNKWF